MKASSGGRRRSLAAVTGGAEDAVPSVAHQHFEMGPTRVNSAGTAMNDSGDTAAAGSTQDSSSFYTSARDGAKNTFLGSYIDPAYSAGKVESLENRAYMGSARGLLRQIGGSNPSIGSNHKATRVVPLNSDDDVTHGPGHVAAQVFRDAFGAGNVRVRATQLLQVPKNFMVRWDQIPWVWILQSLVVLASIVSYALETLPELRDRRELWLYLEASFSSIFTVEVILRGIAAKREGPIAMRLYWRDYLVWIDIMSVVPFYLSLALCSFEPLGEQCDARSLWYIRVLQAIKVLRVFKLSRHLQGKRILIVAMRRSYRALQVPLFFLTASMAVFATLLYLLESSVSDCEESSFLDVVNSAYFVVVTMTSVVSDACARGGRRRRCARFYRSRVRVCRVGLTLIRFAIALCPSVSAFNQTGLR